MAENIILKERRDLSIIGYDRPISLYSDNGLEVEVVKQDNELSIHLIIDSVDVMSTKTREHLSIKKDVEECPNGARVFIAGLGFGIALLYLAESKKSKEVLIVEIDDRVIKKFAPSITDYLRKNYPDFNFKIIKGDANIEVLKNGLFNWVYMDLTFRVSDDLQQVINTILLPEGKQTHWQPWPEKFFNIKNI